MIDVVPAEGWDAFKPRIIDNTRFNGRGSADMKGSIVSLLMALESTQNRKQKFDISIAITTDEELSQASQLRYLATFLNPVADARVFSLRLQLRVRFNRLSGRATDGNKSQRPLGSLRAFTPGCSMPWSKLCRSCRLCWNSNPESYRENPK